MNDITELVGEGERIASKLAHLRWKNKTPNQRKKELEKTHKGFSVWYASLSEEEKKKRLDKLNRKI